MMLKVIIVDDELNARENLMYLLHNFCDCVEILDMCNHVDAAVESIKKNKPDLVFLDIEMPQKNGFQLLKDFDKVDFHIIFVTAYDQYAIKAFDVSAIDYLLKPIDIDRLCESVTKVNQKIDYESYQNRLAVLNSNKKEITKVSIPYKNDYIILNIEDIECIEADRMYSNIYLNNGIMHTVSKKLSQYEDLFDSNVNMQRVHRSWLVNLNYVSSYSISNKELELIEKKVPVSKTYKEKIERMLGR